MTVEIYALMIAGSLSPFVIMAVKSYFGGLESRAAVGLSIGVAAALTFGAELAVGDLAQMFGWNAELISRILQKIGGCWLVGQGVYNAIRTATDKI